MVRSLDDFKCCRGVPYRHHFFDLIGGRDIIQAAGNNQSQAGKGGYGIEIDERHRRGNHDHAVDTIASGLRIDPSAK